MKQGSTAGKGPFRKALFVCAARQTLLAAAALACLAGCGAKLGEGTVAERSSRVLLVDVFERRWGGDVAALELAAHRKLPGYVWRGPRMVDDGKPPPEVRQRLVASTLMRVEIKQYPKISCSGVGPRTTPEPAEPTSGPPMLAADVDKLGAPEVSHEIWMIGAATAVAAPWGFGPEWLGNYLRLAGTGRAVHFPPAQDCAAMAESGPERLPRTVFMGRNEIVVTARTPFTARVLEACPAELAIRERVVRSWHIPLKRFGFGDDVGFRDERTLGTASVVGRCARGEARFDLGPFASRSAATHADPRATIIATLP